MSSFKVSGDNILGHIVGLNNCLKERFIDEVESSGTSSVLIKDIDQITNQLRSSPEFIKLHRQLQKASGSQKQKLNRNLHTFWKEKLAGKLQNIVTRNKNKPIVFLGLSTFHRNHRIRVPIEAKNYWFVSLSDDKSARELIEFNLDKYRQYIVNGSFPLKYVDHKFLIKQRDRIRTLYQNMGFQLKGYKSIVSRVREMSLDDNHEPTIKQKQQGGGHKHDYPTGQRNREKHRHVKSDWEKPEKGRWYVGSMSQYGKEISPIKHKRGQRNRVKALRAGLITGKVISYNQPWLAILGSISNINHVVVKGFQETNKGKTYPFIKERYKGAFSELERACWLHQVDWNGKPPQEHKMIFHDKVPVNQKRFIPNIKKQLERYGVRFIVYHDDE